MRWGFKKEIDMFIWIWENRPHASELSGEPLSYFSVAQFLHVLPKGLNKYPHYRLNPENILLGTMEEHHLVDMGTQREITEHTKKHLNFSIEVFTNLQEKLKEQYHKEFL
jgi:hypothetical protein